MMMGSGPRRFALTTHITASVGLLGAIAAFLALAICGLTAIDERTVRAVYIAMKPMANFVIVPLAVAALLTGLVQSLGTPWGVFRHYWIVAKLGLTVFATVILLIKLRLIAQAAQLAAETVLPHADLRQVGLELMVHAAGGLLVLLVPAILSIYRPWGRTIYGLRK